VVINECDTDAGDSSCVCVMTGTSVDVSSVLEGFWNNVIGLWGDLSVMVLNLTKCFGVFAEFHFLADGGCGESQVWHRG
jgi:hypothetical protein